jgi:hypothetical protein
MDTRKHVKLHTGSLITLKSIADLLYANNIPSIIKNVFESAILAGFASSDTSNEILVYEDDFNKAKELLEKFKKGA